jgi:hypothetical protein
MSRAVSSHPSDGVLVGAHNHRNRRNTHRQLVEDSNRRIVSTEDQLLDVVVASLGRLQRRLQGETPAVRGTSGTPEGKSPRRTRRICPIT